MRLTRALVVAGLVALAAPAAAQIQTTGRQAWPGKLLLGVHPLGVAVTLHGPSFTIYKMNVDFAGRIAETGPLSIWLGGELNVGGRGNYAQVEPGVFVLMTFEKLINKPLVPYVRFGVIGIAGITFGCPANNPGCVDAVVGAFGGKFGGGFHYWITKNIGLGGETNFVLGGGGFGTNAIGFAGQWEFVAGARFAF